jgi:predicted adenylyl cyclase CyaB
MARNIEIKARVAALADIEARARQLSGREPVDLEQDDTFFVCPQGRLKLRSLGGGQAELIFYRREDVPGPKLSTYSIVPVAEPDLLREVLSAALDTAGRVRKRRRVYFVGQTRVHLDDVQHLGTFVELEVVLEPGQSAQMGVHVAHELLAALGVAEAALVPCAYVDLMSESAARG